MKRNKYSKEFKQEAVNLVLREGLSVNQVSSDLGLKPTTLHNWLSKSKSGLLDPGSAKSQELSELKHLRKELRQVKLERDILKEATAFFAKQ